MKYIVNNSHDPEYNMAFEEYCFRNLPLENEEYVFLWSNSPTILLGKNQNTYQYFVLFVVFCRHAFYYNNRKENKGYVKIFYVFHKLLLIKIS